MLIVVVFCFVLFSPPNVFSHLICPRYYPCSLHCMGKKGIYLHCAEKVIKKKGGSLPWNIKTKKILTWPVTSLIMLLAKLAKSTKHRPCNFNLSCYLEDCLKFPLCHSSRGGQPLFPLLPPFPYHSSPLSGLWRLGASSTPYRSRPRILLDSLPFLMTVISVLEVTRIVVLQGRWVKLRWDFYYLDYTKESLAV